MDFVKLIYSGNRYHYQEGSNLKMDILGCFMASDLKSNGDFYKDWATNNSMMSVYGNITSLDKENGHIYLGDIYSEENIPTKIELTAKQFVQLLDDWQDKVYMPRPTEVLIKRENGEFIIETKN